MELAVAWCNSCSRLELSQDSYGKCLPNNYHSSRERKTKADFINMFPKVFKAEVDGMEGPLLHLSLDGLLYRGESQHDECLFQ